ncbi:MAG: ATP-grasp domain-containing protein [Lachnospiraceae bacterium]|nr:ATP-grasp domain-containing protein [Lachnospiraceae bacterium]
MHLLILSCGTRTLLTGYFMDRANGFDRVVTTDCSALAPALYVSDACVIAPRMDDPSYPSFLLELCDREQIDVILPLHEDELLFLAKNRAMFESRGITCVISGEETVALCRDKAAFADAMRKEGIPVAETHTAKEVAEGTFSPSFPVYVKPRAGAGSEGNQVVRTRALLDALCEESPDLILQPYLTGTEYGVHLYADLCDSHPAGAFVLQKIRMRAGETEKSVSVRRDDIRDLAFRVATSCPFRGPVDMDVMETEEGLFLLEVNPRFGGAYPQAYVCGVNFPKMIAQNAGGVRLSEGFDEYPEGVTALRYADICVRESLL